MKLEKEYGEINGKWEDIKESVASKVREMIDDFSEWWNNDAEENEFGGVYLNINNTHFSSKQQKMMLSVIKEIYGMIQFEEFLIVTKHFVTTCIVMIGKMIFIVQ